MKRTLFISEISLILKRSLDQFIIIIGGSLVVVKHRSFIKFIIIGVLFVVVTRRSFIKIFF
jgi:hypothetical protein